MSAVVEAGTTILSKEVEDRARAMDISPDGSKIAVAIHDSSNYPLFVHDLENDEEISRISLSNYGEGIDYYNGEITVAVLYLGIKRYDENLNEIDEFQKGTGFWFDYSPDRGKIVTRTSDGILVFDSDTGDDIFSINLENNAYSGEFSDNGEKIVVGDGVGHVIIIDVENEEIEKEYKIFNDSTVVRWSKDEILAFEYREQTEELKIIDPKTGDAKVSLNLDSASIRSGGFFRENDYIAIIDDDKREFRIFSRGGEKIFSKSYSGLHTSEYVLTPDYGRVAIGDYNYLKVVNVVDEYINIIDKTYNIDYRHGVLLGDSTDGKFSLNIGGILLEEESDIIPLGFVNLTGLSIQNVEITSTNIDSGITFTKSKEEEPFAGESSLNFAGPYEYEAGDDFYVHLDTDNTAPVGDGTLELNITAEFTN